MNKKNCMLCEHWEFDGGSPEYSEWTPGSDWSMECHKNIWKCDKNYMTKKEFVRCMKHAEKCAFYIISEDINNE